MIRDLIMFALGALVTGVIANRRPQWFSKAVVSVNALDDKINALLKDKLATPAPAPAPAPTPTTPAA